MSRHRVSRRWLPRLAALVTLAVAAPLPPGDARADSEVAAPAPAPRKGPEIGYDPERGAYVRTADGAWELNPFGMVQLRNVTLLAPGEPLSTTFSLQAAKVILRGHIFHPTVSYNLQLNAGSGRVVAEDVFLRWDPWRSVRLVAGQFPVPFNRQRITQDAHQELVERSIADLRFSLQRDIGFAAWLSDPDHRFEATLGVWNGARQNSLNDDETYMGTLRLAYNPLGPILFQEADLADSRSPRLSIAVAGAYNPARVVKDPNGEAPPVELRNIVQGVFEMTFRYRGLSLTTEVHARRLEEAQGPVRVDYGGFGQIGVFVLPRRLQFVGRFSALDGDLSPQDTSREVTAGAGWYFHGHRFKIQADYSRLQTRDSRQTDRVRLQLQAFF